MSIHRMALASLLASLPAGQAAAAVTQTTYQIVPGGVYQYLPSPESPGISGGAPSAFQLDFGIGGTFVYELDIAVPTARLLNLNLVLTGNEAIQAAPPSPYVPVTADRVEEFLASQTFVEDFTRRSAALRIVHPPRAQTHRRPQRQSGDRGRLRRPSR